MDFECERCSRKIKRKGRCLPCNYFYKHKKYFPGLLKNPDYDKVHGIEPELAEKLINSERKQKIEPKQYKYEKICSICGNKFKTNHDEFKTCYNCYKFFTQYGGIETYKKFLEAFNLLDNENTKSNYIEFIDNKNKYLKIKGDWKIEKILTNPGEYLDRIKTAEKKLKDIKKLKKKR